MEGIGQITNTLTIGARQSTPSQRWLPVRLGSPLQGKLFEVGTRLWPSSRAHRRRVLGILALCVLGLGAAGCFPVAPVAKAVVYIPARAGASAGSSPVGLAMMGLLFLYSCSKCGPASCRKMLDTGEGSPSPFNAPYGSGYSSSYVPRSPQVDPPRTDDLAQPVDLADGGTDLELQYDAGDAQDAAQPDLASEDFSVESPEETPQGAGKAQFDDIEKGAGKATFDAVQEGAGKAQFDDIQQGAGKASFD